MRTPLSKYGQISQIAFVSRDLDKDIKFWTEVIGAGPFFLLEHLQLSGTRYRGAPTNVDMSAALGYWGDIQIEFIVQHNEAPSIYTDWLKSGATGIQHLGIIVDDFDAAHAGIVRDGGIALQETEIPDTIRASYFSIQGQVPLIEILGMEPEFQALWDYMRRQAVDWDGSNPVRAVPAESEWSLG